MKIHLKNFRCYEDKEFDFGEIGLVLLSGASGSGKSTILNGIYFALYGEGTKVIMYGKNNCKVEVDFGDIRIIRTKRPNHLSVTIKKQDEEDDNHEDESAQDIINKRFGDMFDITGYVAQNAINSFVMMNPIDKLSFLEKFAFKDINISDVKARCKSVIKDRKEIHIAISSQLEMAISMLSQIKKPENIKFPFKTTNQEKYTKNEEIKHKNCNILIKKARHCLKDLFDRLSSLKVLETNLKNKKELIETIIQKLTKLEKDKVEIVYKGDEFLEKYEKILENILNNKKLYTLKTKYQEDLAQFNIMKNNELTEINKELKDINETLWVEHTNKDICESIIEQKQLVVDIETIKQLEKEKINFTETTQEEIDLKLKELSSYRDNIDEKKRIFNKLNLQKEIYKCPKCNTNLSFSENKLCETRETKDDSSLEDIKKEIKKLTVIITTIESDISIMQNNYRKNIDIQTKINNIKNKYDDISVYNIHEIKDDIEYMKQYRDTHIKLETRKKELDMYILSNKFSNTLTSLQNNIEQQLNIIKLLEKKKIEQIEYIESEKEVRVIIETQKTIKLQLDNIETSFNTLLEEKKKFEKDIKIYEKSYLDIYSNITSTDDIKIKISEKEKEIEDLEMKQEVHANNLKQIEKYKEYEKELVNYNNLIKKKEELEIQEKKDRLRYAASTFLMEKILEAESIAILNVVNSINTHVQLYLDCFFPDNPLSAKLLTFKETKKLSKPQINMLIEYKGMECDINMLSGGELSRVILAFTLALGEMFNTPIILLDECTSSLDQDLSGIIINGIRENFSNKLVVVISHQNVCGIYDRVIEIKN